MTIELKNPETIALHAGYRADPATGSVAVPIYQTTSYQFGSTEHASNLFALKELGNIYTRIMNPTADVLEKRVAALEGGVAALALASGQAASAFAVQNLARAGDNIVSSTDLYGGTWNLFANTMRDQGIEVRFVDPSDPQNFRKATDDRTRAYYAETLPNPKLAVFPIAEVAEIGRPLGIPLIMDNTASPGPVQAARPWRGYRRVLDDQVHRRPRHVDRRPVGRWRQLRLGGPPGAPAGAEHARSELSWRGLDRGDEADGPVAYIIKARTTLLRDLGARDVAVQRLPVHPGPGDAAAAHARALRERDRGRALSRAPSVGVARSSSPAR